MFFSLSSCANRHPLSEKADPDKLHIRLKALAEARVIPWNTFILVEFYLYDLQERGVSVEGWSYEKIIASANRRRELQTTYNSKLISNNHIANLSALVDNRGYDGFYGRKYLNFDIIFKNLGNDPIGVINYTVLISDPFGNEIYTLSFGDEESILWLPPNKKNIEHLRFEFKQISKVLGERNIILAPYESREELPLSLQITILYIKTTT